MLYGDEVDLRLLNLLPAWQIPNKHDKQVNLFRSPPVGFEFLFAVIVMPAGELLSHRDLLPSVFSLVSRKLREIPHVPSRFVPCFSGITFPVD